MAEKIICTDSTLDGTPFTCGLYKKFAELSPGLAAQKSKDRLAGLAVACEAIKSCYLDKTKQ